MPKLYGYTEILGDVLITGSFSILGSASTINSTNLTVEDSIIALSHGQTGSPVLDAGIFFIRGTGDTQAFIWDESVDEFALVQTSDDHTVIGNINITGYSNLRLGNIGIGGAPSANTTAYIKGINATSSNYALKVENSSSTSLLSVRNDGLIGMGEPTPTARLSILTPDNLVTSYGIRVRQNVSGDNLFYIKGNGYCGFPGLYTRLGVGDEASSNSRLNVAGLYNAPPTDYIFAAYPYGGVYIAFGVQNNGNVGIGGNAGGATSRLHIKGSGTSSGAYSLKIDDVSNNNLFSILDNGQVNFNTTVDTWGTYNFTSTGGNVISVSSLSSGSYAGILFNTEGSARFFIDTNATGTRIRTQGTTNMYLARGVAEQEVLSFGPNYIQMEAPVGVGIGKYGPSVSARLHIQGSGTSSGTYSLKIDDGGGNPLLYVRNDGNATLVDATIGRGNGQILGNIAFGINSLFNNLTGYNNTAVGYYTLSSNTSGQDNTAFGTNALRTNSTGYENVAIGSALVSNTTGVYNVAVGSGALLSNSTGSNNVSVGKSALGSNTTASGNIGIGYRSLNDNTVGAVNVAIGGDAALFSQQGSGSIGLGFYAGQQSNGNNNIFIGTYAGAYLTASSNRLFIDNSNGRANVAGDEENGLITGLFSSSANSQYLRLNANVGVGITASSRLHIKGIDNTSSNYALKVESASASSILLVRNDGYVQTAGLLKVLSSALYPSLTFENSVGHTANIQMYYNELYFTTGGQQTVLNATGLSLGTNAGAGAKLQVRGINATSSNYALKVENSSSTSLLSIRNDGNIGVNYPVGVNDTKFFINGGLTTENLYAFRVDAGSGNNVLNVKNNGDFGVGTIPGTKFFIRGSDGNIGINFSSGATNGTKLYIDGGLASANEYAVRVDGDGNQLFNIKNNGNIGIGTTSPTTLLYLEKDFDGALLTISQLSSAHGCWIKFKTPLNTSFIGKGQDTTFSTYDEQDSLFRFEVLRNGSYQYRSNTIDCYQSFNTPTKIINAGINELTYFLYDINQNRNLLRFNHSNGFGGTNIETPTAQWHIKGIDNTSSNYALKVESASASSILSVRNDGRVFIGKSIIANAPMEVGFGQDPYSTGYNTALGVNSLNSWNGAYSAGANIAVGYETLKNLTTGQYNVGVGYKALTNVVTGGYNTALNYSLISNLTGEYNVALGYGNLNVSTSSNTNIAIGRDNLFSFTSGTNNIAISGYAGLYNLVTGSNNIAIGYLSLAYVTSASFNTVIGNLSLNNDPFTGDNNTVIGASNLTSVTTGSNNTVIGRNIQSWTSSLSNNILIGDGSGNIRIMSDSTGNIGIGLTGPSYPLHVVGTVSSDAGYNIGATAGFTGTGAYTNFTIIGGIIVSAS